MREKEHREKKIRVELATTATAEGIDDGRGGMAKCGLCGYMRYREAFGVLPSAGWADSVLGMI